MLCEVELPSEQGNQLLTLAGTAIKMTETPGGVRHRAPLTGEHTAEVLADFGFNESDIETLASSGVIAVR